MRPPPDRTVLPTLPRCSAQERAAGLVFGLLSVLVSCLGPGLAPGRAAAEELTLGASAEFVYDSNFFSSATDEEDAFLFVVGPIVQLTDPDGRFTYDLEYRGGYDAYVNQDDANAWESRLRARASYEIDRLTEIRVTERFRDISNLRFSREDINDQDSALDPRRDQYYRNDLEIELIRTLTRRFQVTGRVAHHWIDFKNNTDRNDSHAFDLGGELDYLLTTTHTVGAGLVYSYQDFESARERLGSTGQYLNAFVAWTWDIASNIQFDLRGGPSWVHSNEDDASTVEQTQYVGGKRGGNLFRADFDSCQPDPVASDCRLDDASIAASDLGPTETFTLVGERVNVADTVTFFGGSSLFMDLAEWDVLALYQRRQSTTSGDGLASSLDHVELEIEYQRPDQPWSVFVAGAFDRRETLTEATDIDFVVQSGVANAAERIPGGAFTEIDRGRDRRDAYTAIVGVRSAFVRQLAATLEFRYRRTQTFNRGRQPGEDTYFVVLSTEYLHDPFQF